MGNEYVQLCPMVKISHFSITHTVGLLGLTGVSDTIVRILLKYVCAYNVQRSQRLKKTDRSISACPCATQGVHHL